MHIWSVSFLAGFRTSTCWPSLDCQIGFLHSNFTRHLAQGALLCSGGREECCRHRLRFGKLVVAWNWHRVVRIRLWTAWAWWYKRACPPVLREVPGALGFGEGSRYPVDIVCMHIYIYTHNIYICIIYIGNIPRPCLLKPCSPPQPSNTWGSGPTPPPATEGDGGCSTIYICI